MRVNILTGTRFQAGLVINILSNMKTSVNIYSSSPASKWNFANPKYVSLHFVPLFSAIFSHLTKINSPTWFKEISSVLFDFFASFMMRKCDVLHAWSSFGFYSVKKAKQQKGPPAPPKFKVSLEKWLRMLVNETNDESMNQHWKSQDGCCHFVSFDAEFVANFRLLSIHQFSLPISVRNGLRVHPARASE